MSEHEHLQHAVKEGREFLKNQSKEGEEKLQKFLQEEFKSLSRDDFDHLIFQLRKSPENKVYNDNSPYKNTVNIEIQQDDNDPHVDLSDVVTTRVVGGVRERHPMQGEEKSQTAEHSQGAGSYLERAVHNFFEQKKLIEDPNSIKE